MKRLSLVLALLLVTTPAMATVRIIVEPDGQMAAIRYETDGEKVRAFALDVVAGNGTIDRVSGFVRGQSTADNPGYGIFPANFNRYISVDGETGNVADWGEEFYTPVADSMDPNALGGLGTSGVTLEMGALYYPTDDSSPNAPADSGLLCLLELSQQTTLTVMLNEARGGVVLTNPSIEADVDLTQAAAVVSGSSGSNLLARSHPDYAEWVAVGKPACWAYPRQCYGDADGRMEARPTDQYPQGGYSYVGANDLAIYLEAKEVLESPFGPGIASVANGVCADFAHDKGGDLATGFYRVGVTDLNILVANWMLTDIPGNCGGTLQP